MDINYNQDALLMLSSMNFPDGIQVNKFCTQINGHTILCYLQWVGLFVGYLEQASNCTAESRDNNRNGKE